MTFSMDDASKLNLETHRSPDSVWARSGWDGTPQPLALTRWLIGAAGAALAVNGIRQRSVSGSILAGVGAGFAWWALGGECGFASVRQRAAGLAGRFSAADHDAVHEASDDSFPASDAPSWTPTVGTGLRKARASAPR